MTTHLSVRLAWHDRGWDGHVCDHPMANFGCIAHQHIRSSRQDELERTHAGQRLESLHGWLPPCCRDPGAYSKIGYRISHEDPLEREFLLAIDEEVPPYSCCPSPYRWMREESFMHVCESENLDLRGPNNSEKELGWVSEPDRQEKLLGSFWDKVEKGASLIFYYCKPGTPVDEDSPRILAGIGRLSDVARQLYFKNKGNQGGRRYPIWSRRITQNFPSEGLRIPYQEYLRLGKPLDQIVCRVPLNALLDFSYVASHVTDGEAISVIERAIQSIETVKSDGVVKGDWDRHLAWLNDILSEAWRGRGAYPGIGSVLQSLGFSKGTAYQRMVLSPLSKNGQDPWKHVLAILEGSRPLEPGPWTDGLQAARSQWVERKSKHDLFNLLVRFEVAKDQVVRIINPDTREESGVTATEREILTNPYVLFEQDLGTTDSEPIDLHVIDQGVLPSLEMARLYKDPLVSVPDDKRRIRATAVWVLRQAAARGDSALPLDQLIQRIAEAFPRIRRCQPDRDVMKEAAAFYGQVLSVHFDEQPPWTALGTLYELESHICELAQRRASRRNDPPQVKIDWERLLRDEFKGEPENAREMQARAEKARALQALFDRRLSVLTGGAGTGKTRVLKVFLETLLKVEGREPFLLLAPTGKARVRLQTQTKMRAQTIHQLLMKQGWLSPTMALAKASKLGSLGAKTVIIDECSMIPSDLLATLLKALDTNSIKRLILVGDPSQLPPIGAGRPFIDLITFLDEQHPECIAKLKTCMRSEEGEKGEVPAGLRLAEGFRSEDRSSCDEEVLSAIARGETFADLIPVFWKGHAELAQRLWEVLGQHLAITKGDARTLDRSLGYETKQWNLSEAWQILCPSRSDASGTEDLNRLIQLEFRREAIEKASHAGPHHLKPVGDQQLVLKDKIIQVKNRKMRGTPDNMGINYVANGEIGLVARASTSDTGPFFDVHFSTQPEVHYRYFGRIEENLELAYALTVHKAQGSDFETVILILPKNAGTYSRELLYTALTRYKRRVILLLEEDTGVLEAQRHPKRSDTQARRTSLSWMLSKKDVKQRQLEGRANRTRKGELVLSKSEVIVADTLNALGISYVYEQKLASRDNPKDFRLPDFTVSYEGDTYWWEHLGMLDTPSYREAWERKKAWYERNDYSAKLITSEDRPGGGIDASKIEKIARTRILCEV
jgi:exodeoxyribonuclease V alpha subunit